MQCLFDKVTFMTNLLRHYIIAFLLLLSASAAASDIVVSSHVSSANGLSSNIVHAIVQDKDGYMWFGTVNGLCRFDGYSFVNYSSLCPDPQKHIVASIASIVADNKRGLIWVTTPRNQVACYDTNTSQFADYTGRGDYEKQFRRLLPCDEGMWMYDTRSGARFVEYADGQFTATDYNADNHLPSSYVVEVIIDRRGNVWIATDNGITMVLPDKTVRTICSGRLIADCNTDGKHVFFLTKDGTTFTYDLNGKLISEKRSPVSDELANSRFVADLVWQGEWYLFTNNTTYAMNVKSGELYRHPMVQIPGCHSLPRTADHQFIANSAGNLWIFSDKGGMRQLELLAEGYAENSVGRKLRVCQGIDNRLYIATQGNGLYVYDPETDENRHYLSADRSPLIHSNSLLALAVDHTGSVWVAEESAGVTCLSTDMDINVEYLRPAPESHNYLANLIKNITQTPDGNFAISTNDGMLYTMTADCRQLAPAGRLSASAYAYMTDSKGNTWIGTRGGGLYINGRHYSMNDSVYRCPSAHIYDIREDSKGRVWIATWGDGLLQTRLGDDGRLHYNIMQAGYFNEKYIRQIHIDNAERLWLATNDGLAMAHIGKDEISDSSFVKFSLDNSMLPTSEIMCICIVRDGTIWLGTQSLGVLMCEYKKDGTLTFKQLSTEIGLVNNNVRSILEDNDGRVWVTTENGMSCIDVANNTIRNYRPSNQLMGNVFSEDCALMTDDGRLLLGTTEGLAVVTLNERPAGEDDMSVRPAVTDIRIDGRSIFRYDNLKQQAQQLLRSETIQLHHDQSSLSFHFSNFAYKDIHSSLYQYWLEGLDNEWRPVSSDNHADYGKLPPGRYVLHLKSMAGNSKWSETETLEIIILQPWYNTWWAWLIYLLLAAGVTYFIYRSWRRNFELHQQMALDKQLNEFRINFFTHIAHEFRTPLALIQGAVDKLVEPQSQMVSKTSMQTVRRGTSRLLRLVNQLMEFRKINTGNLRLAVETTDVIDFVRGIYQDFWQHAKQKNITMTFHPFASRFIMPIDRHMLETMVYNLLSNAVKYTPENGTISVKIKLDESGKDNKAMVAVSVENSGEGISAEQQKNLFRPFMHGYVSQGGMGIGLYNARNMALCHHGNLEHYGTNGSVVFTITIPASDSSYSPDEYKSEISGDTVVKPADNDSEEFVQEMLSEALNHQTVAIIEDDPDMLQQIRNEIGVYFNVNCYTTGQAACDGILEQPPALILCDVMLPDIDGYEIVRRIRKDEGSLNTPVIMLTALDDEQHQLRAYRAGADDYVTKPCNFKLLVARISRMIEWSDRVRIQQPETDETAPVAMLQDKILLDKQDKLFRDRVQAIILRHISDPAFSVDNLASEMAMGRTKFYGKVKELLGVSPNKLLMNERMRIAAEMLVEGRYTASEVAYKTGFDNQSYFNKCFKKYYGVPPGQYKG